MEFHPEDLFDDNCGENFVWDALKAALAGMPGAAYYRVPIFNSAGLRTYEPDVLIVSQDAMPLLIECKGCVLDDVVEIRGACWVMREGWHRRQEQPTTQARNQAIALRTMLEARQVQGVNVQALVAVPFISREEWIARGFGQLGITDGLLFADDFAPAHLRSRIEVLLAPYPLSPDRAQAVQECLRGGRPLPAALLGSSAPAVTPSGSQPLPEAGADIASAVPQCSPVTLLRYVHQPPTAQELAEAIGLSPDQPCTYIVATSALERQRAAECMGGPHQLRKQLRRGVDQPESMQLVFHKALRHFIRQRVLTRAEEGVMLHRAIHEVMAGDTLAAAQVVRDVLRWREVLAELEEEGIDLQSPAGAGAEDWAHPALRDVARALQGAYRRTRQQAGQNLFSFEEVARNHLDTTFRPTPVVVMEGFTRLTPLQRRFIETCARHPGCHVWLVVPYEPAQQPGFAAVERAYASLRVPVKTIDVLFNMTSTSTALTHLQLGLFANAVAARSFPGDASVALRPFAHRNDEVAACVDRVIALLEDARSRYPAREIAVVCSDPHTYTPLLREQAKLRGWPELFAVQPRQLLLTPVGRFALTLYEVWQNNALCLDLEQFATLLSSGWLGAQAQRSVDRFRAVAAQQFARCRTEQEWRDAFVRVRRLHPGQVAAASLASRLPASLVDDASLAHWEEALNVTTRLCERLLRPGERSLGKHIDQLLDEIGKLDPHRVLASEREILRRIGEALDELRDARSVSIDGHEFGRILSGLIHERQEEDAGPPVDGTGHSRVWVTGPEGVDGVVRDVIFFLGLDDQRLPAPGRPPWPRAKWSAQEHVERQRYRFLAVVRAARRRLWFSFAWQDWESDQRPSAYLEEVAYLLERDDVLQPPAVTTCVPRPDNTAEEAGNRALRRYDYDLDELAVWRLCPHRFKLESLNPWGRCYANAWQLQWAARGAWLTEACALVAHTESAPASPDALATALRQAVLDATTGVRERFAGLADLDWLSVERGVRSTVEYLLRGKGLEAIERADLRQGQVELALPQASHSVKIHARYGFQLRREGQYKPLLDDRQAAIWLTHGRSGNGSDPQASEEKPGRAPNLYEAVRWWRRMHYALAEPQSLKSNQRNELADVIRALEKRPFTKYPGDHCRYCPVQATCMGVKP
jgi:hypothetical protein